MGLLKSACAGLPLIVHERFLAAYDFIPRNAVAVIGPEGDAGAMQALLALTPMQLEAKLLNVRLLLYTKEHIPKPDKSACMILDVRLLRYTKFTGSSANAARHMLGCMQASMLMFGLNTWQ